MSRLAVHRPPIWLAAYLVVLVIWLVGLYLPLYFSAFPRPIDSLDFSYYYGAARIGLEDGWGQIYDVGLQQQVFYQLRVFTARLPYGAGAAVSMSYRIGRSSAWSRSACTPLC
jgi:hypothetical protein